MFRLETLAIVTTQRSLGACWSAGSCKDQAFGISNGQPYMVNMAFDPMLAGCLIYLIQAGMRKIEKVLVEGLWFRVGIAPVLSEGDCRS